MRLRMSWLVVSALVVGCHSSPAAPAGPFSGHWVGPDKSSTVTLDLNLKDNANDGGVSGSGSISGPGGSIAVTVSGSESGTDASVTLNAPPYTHADLAGPMANGVWAAVLDGSGFASDSVRLQKQ